MIGSVTEVMREGAKGVVSRVGSLVWRWWWMEDLGHERGLEEIATQQWMAGVKGLEWGDFKRNFAKFLDKRPQS